MPKREDQTRLQAADNDIEAVIQKLKEKNPILNNFEKLKEKNPALNNFDLTKDNVFVATKPEKSLLEWFWLVNSRLFFPPLLIWDGLKHAVNSLANRYARDALILPGRKTYTLHFTDDMLRKKIEKDWAQQNTPQADRKPIEQAITDTRASYEKHRIKQLAALSGKEDIKQRAQKEGTTENDIDAWLEKRTIGGHSFVVLNENTGSFLHTFEMTHENQTKKPDGNDNPIENQRYVIYFNGNEEWMPDAVLKGLEEDHGLNSNLVFFDYTGVGLSSPRDAMQHDKDLRAMGLAQVERLLKKGVRAENIFLKGYSLGGVSATLTAAACHDCDDKVNLFSDRSFSNSTNLVTGYIRTGATLSHGYEEPLLFKVLSMVAYPFVRLLTALSGYEMNAGDAYHSIPETHKTYVCVRSNKSARTANPNENRLPIDDPIMPHYASLHTYGPIEEKRKHVKTTFKQVKEELNKFNNKIQPEPIMAATGGIDNAMQALKVHKLRPIDYGTHNYTTNQHIQPLRFFNLADQNATSEKNGGDIYRDFVKATETRHRSAAVNR